MKFLILLSWSFGGLFQLGECQHFVFGKMLTSFIGRFNEAVNTENNMETVWSYIAHGDSDESRSILRDLGIIKDQLEHMDEYISSRLDNIENILQQLQRGPEIRDMKRELSVAIQSVIEAHGAFFTYLSQSRSIKEEALIHYINNYFDRVNSFVEIQKKIAPSADVAVIGVDSLPVLLAKDMNKNRKYLCGTGATAQQYLMNLFMLILETEVKAVVVLTFMGALKFRRNNGWEIYKSELLRQSQTRYDAYVTQFSNGLHLASLEHRPCDADSGWIEGVTYWGLNGFNQATMFRAPQDWIHPKYIPCDDRAAELNRRQFTGICVGSNLADCYDRPEEVCYGNLMECTALKVSERCLLKDPLRRYRWIKNHYTGEIWGRVQDGCRDGEVLPKENWGACLCHCIGRSNKISLELSMSQIHKHRVVTAMRFHKMNNVIFIQIKEGKIGPNGTITEHFDEWKPTHPATDPKNLMVFDTIENAFHTDDVRGRHNEVLIGIGFTRAEDNDKRIKLQIQVIKVNYRTGEILGRRRNITSSAIANDDLIIGDENSANPFPSIENSALGYSERFSRSHLTAGAEATSNVTFVAGNPVNALNGSGLLHESVSGYDAISKILHAEDSSRGHHVRFYRSLLTEDAGQATLPLFDATPVEGIPVSPLSGAGLLHKGFSRYAGFLALKAIGQDLSYYFDKYYLYR